MDAARLTEQIEEEIAGDWSVTNWHGVDLRHCLVKPVKKVFRDWRDEEIELWLVLEEDPENGSGYKIVYDDGKGMYGLVIVGESDDVFIGYYGTFLETLAGM